MRITFTRDFHFKVFSNFIIDPCSFVKLTYQIFITPTRNLHKPDKCKSEADEDLGVSSCWSDAVGSMGVISVPETESHSSGNGGASRLSAEKKIVIQRSYITVCAS